MLPSYLLSASKQQISESKLVEFNEINKDITSFDMDTTISDINTKLEILSSANGGHSVYEDILTAILASRPKGVTFNQIVFNQKKDKKLSVDIHGKALDRATLRNFKAVLDSNPKIATVTLPISDFLEKTNLNFTISLIMK